MKGVIVLWYGENSCFKMALEFLSCVQTALLWASYDNIIFKAKQVICLERLYLRKYLLAVLPTCLLRSRFLGSSRCGEEGCVTCGASLKMAAKGPTCQQDTENLARFARE